MMYSDINDVFIGDELIGTEKIDNKFVNEYANLKAVVLNKTSNTVEVYIYTKSAEGINCYQWFRFGDFIKQFKFA
jgi:hypothetical protein